MVQFVDSSPTTIVTSPPDVDQQIKQYRFKIEAIFDHKEAREAFREFLKKDCLNEEPLLFYECVEKYMNTRLDRNRFELSAEIIDNFIVVGAIHELNLSMNIRNDILKRWEQLEEQNKSISSDSDLITCPIDLYSRAQDVVFIELKQDNFPRFIDSETFKRFIVKEMKSGNNNSILETLGTCKFNSRTSSLGNSDSLLNMNYHNSSTSTSNATTPTTTTNYSSSRTSIASGSTTTTTPTTTTNHSLSQSSLLSASGDMTPRSEEGENDSLEEKIATLYENQADLHERVLLPIIDEMSPYVTPKDYDLGMKLVNSLNDSNVWKVIGEKVGLKTLVSNPIFSFSPRKSENSKFIVCNSGILNGKPREWLNLLFSDQINKKIQERSKKRFQVDYVKIDPKNGVHFPNTIVYTEVQLPFPLTNRDFTFCRTVIPDLYNETTGEYDRYVLIQKPTHHHEYPARNSPIRGLHYIFYIVEKKTQSSVKYSVFETGELSGKIPPKIVAGFFKSIAGALHKKMVKACEKVQVAEEVRIKDSDGALSTLNEMVKYLENERMKK